MSHKSPPDREFDMKIQIAAPPDAVWKAISDDTELCRWFAPEATIEARVGGQVVWRWGNQHSWVQRVEICEPGRRLRTRYDSPVDDGEGGKRPLFIDFVLEGEGGMTTLRLTQSGFGPEAAFDEEYDGISHGWPVELRSLRLYLETHRGKERQLAWSNVEVAMAPETAWRLLTGPKGLACGPGIKGLSPGEAFRFTTRLGDVFEGKALLGNPLEFAGQVESHGDGFLRFTAYRYRAKSHVWLWLGCYDQPPDRVQKVQKHFDTMLAKLSAGAREAAEGA